MHSGQSKGACRPKLMKVAEAAKCLDCSERTIWRLLSGRKIQKIKVGKNVRISLEELQRFVADGGVA